MHPLRGRARLLGGCAGVRMALGTQCAGFMPGSEPYQWQMPKAGRGDEQAQLRAARMPRAEPGWGSPPRGSAPRGPCSPAGSVGEYNIAVLICALQECDTGMLFPVSHGLPEDCPLAASEIPSNNKRDDPIGPHPLWSGCRCPPAPRPASPSAPAFPLRLPTSALTTQGRRVSCSFDG